MKIVYVKFERINVKNYLVREKTAVFEVFVDDNYGKEIWSHRFNVETAMIPIIKFVMREEELKHYKLGEGVRVIIQDKDLIKKVMSDFLSDAKKLVEKFDKKEATSYLDTLSRINKLSLNFDKKITELREEGKTKTEDWKEKLSKTRVKLNERKK